MSERTGEGKIMTLKFPAHSDLRCPCDSKSRLKFVSGCLVCENQACIHSGLENSFNLHDDRAVLISTSQCDTICDPNNIGSRVRRSTKKLSVIRRFMGSGGHLSEENCKTFLELACDQKRRSRILIIGSGERGEGTQAIWDSENIDVYGTDIYLSENVSTICDAHYLPFPDSFFDGVWAQAVLEHVVDPPLVVSEIARVLKKRGLVYSEVPFMQQVHEGAYDFTRFTLSGHRYLFKHFEIVKLGVLDGPNMALAWSFRYWVWALTRSRSLARLANMAITILSKPLVFLESPQSRFDSYSASFFLGQKSNEPAKHQDLIAIYDGNVS